MIKHCFKTSSRISMTYRITLFTDLHSAQKHAKLIKYLSSGFPLKSRLHILMRNKVTDFFTTIHRFSSPLSCLNLRMHMVPLTFKCSQQSLKCYHHMHARRTTDLKTGVCCRQDNTHDT